MSKIRVRLCLKDIYRYIVTGEKCDILGISEWTATATKISIRYEGERRWRHYKTFDEDLRLMAIKKINKRISEVH